MDILLSLDILHTQVYLDILPSVDIQAIVESRVIQELVGTVLFQVTHHILDLVDILHTQVSPVIVLIQVSVGIRHFQDIHHIVGNRAILENQDIVHTRDFQDTVLFQVTHHILDLVDILHTQASPIS